MKLEAALAECPVVAILRGVQPSEVLAHVEALFVAGIRGVEVPLNSPGPLESIRRIADAFGDRMAIGAGTVLMVEQVPAVAAAGGRMVVSPNTAQAIILRALAFGLDPVPGFATASEAFAAINAGARHLKLFPATSFSPEHVRQLKAVLPPEVVIWAVGGVGADHMAAWWTGGCRAFGLGGDLYRAGQTVEETAERAGRLVKAVRRLPPSEPRPANAPPTVAP